MEDSLYLSELSKCVRCGSCKALCTTYEEDSTEVMSARGRLALLWGLSSGQLKPSPILNERIFSCTLCGKCSGLCPLEVDIKEVFYHGRALLKRTDKKRRLLRHMAHFCTKNPKFSFRMLRMAQNILSSPIFKKGLFQLHLPERSLKDGLHVVTSSRKKGRVAVFTGCTVNFLYPQIGESLVNVLHKFGYEVVLPSGEVCCGAPLRTLGLEEDAIALAQKNVQLYKKLNVEAVLSLCPSCTLTIRKDYPGLIGEGIERAVDISEFFINTIDFSQQSLSLPFIKKALFHTPCHLKYGLGISEEPRKILRNVGVNLLENKEDRCCGFAGAFCFSFRELSQVLLKNCISGYEKAGAEMIITSCPGCMIQLEKWNKDRPVLHLIEVLDEALSHHS